MKRLTTDIPSGNFETMLNFVYGKDGWAYIRRDGEHEDVRLTAWAKRQCKLHGCDEVWTEMPEEIDQRPEKHGDVGWKGLAAVPWRGSREEAQADLDQLAEKKGWMEWNG